MSKFLNQKNIITILFVTFLYSSFATLSLNYKLVFTTLFADFSFSYKISVLFFLLIGATTAFSKIDFILLIITSILVGINVVLFANTVSAMKTNGGKMKITVGGGGVLGLATTGCASCGFSFLSIVGLGSILPNLPFGSHTIYILPIGLLLASSFYMVKKFNDGNVCNVKRTLIDAKIVN
ncbi:MAG: hypothetical protein Q7R31_02485 [Candidatus Levybacteria bacterium]|nr:hypothetical protein [Candidatus Levybacteria bacterium]